MTFTVLDDIGGFRRGAKFFSGAVAGTLADGHWPDGLRFGEDGRTWTVATLGRRQVLLGSCGEVLLPGGQDGTRLVGLEEWVGS